MRLRRCDARDGFDAAAREVLRRARSFDPPGEDLRASVRAIVDGVRDRGDEALAEYTAAHDGVLLEPGAFRVGEEEVAAALENCDDELLEAMRVAGERIAAFQRALLPGAPARVEAGGVLAEERHVPLRRVGLCIPGGKAIYPSCALATAVPAVVAGVDEIAACAPPRSGGTVAPETLAALSIAGVTEIYRVGGAQAVAAMAYGTGSISRVDKICGPGGIYVTEAKRLVFGEVGIDSLAGPSEVLVVADGSAPAAFVAADLLGQAEHDEAAVAILIATDESVVAAIEEEVTRQLAGLPREEIAHRSLEGQGTAVIVADLDEAARMVNLVAPEHLELVVADPEALARKIRAAGAVFLGAAAPEALGDYAAGPSHVLPTGGTARFSSPLSSLDFLRRQSVIGATAEGMAGLAETVERIARAEGLEAHARSAAIRRRAR